MAHFQATTACPYSLPLFRNSRQLWLTLLLTVMAALMGNQRAQAQDGRAILFKAMQFYHTFNSYSGQANIDIYMEDMRGKPVKHVGSMTTLKFQRPNKIYVYLEDPAGSRKIYSDGTTFSLYEVSPDLYTMSPTSGTQQDLFKLLKIHANVVVGMDALFFLTQTTLPKDLTDIKFKELSSCNGHPAYVVTGTSTETSLLTQNGKKLTTPLKSYWTWWIDSNTYLLYKVETATPNIVRTVALGTPEKVVYKDIKGTLLTRYTVAELRPDAHVSPSDFVFTPPATARRRRTAQEVLKGSGK